MIISIHYIYEQYEKNGTGRFLEEMSPGVSGNGESGETILSK